jgi:hypothetical protein
LLHAGGDLTVDVVATEEGAAAGLMRELWIAMSVTLVGDAADSARI